MEVLQEKISFGRHFVRVILNLDDETKH